MPESARTSEQIPDHTLLRVIGRGSYGEVWLARNVMGTLRAVKIVSRAAFDNDRPWLREFEGIRRCEPVSRAHDGLVDILHMGRNEAQGYFYYVMELADNEGAETTEYRPATLAARLAGGKALAVSECLRLAESLAGTLAFLHENGLIHRDVKPPNVLYVGGVPKLGDIGLVAETGSSRSFVGTEGYVPLEGPGNERADVFALGKVLYEALTGLDRGKFPSLPPDWSRDPDFLQRLELNEIVLRACEGDPARCYRSAREMLVEIALVASGRSVKRLRGIERRLRRLRWGIFAAAAVTMAALGVSALSKRQADREKVLRLRAEKAEDAEREARFTAMLAHVHAARHDSSHGAVAHALDVAREAAALHATPALRDDVVFLLGRADFVARPDLAFTFTEPIATFDADSLRMAEMRPGTGSLPTPLTITLHTAGKPEMKRTLGVTLAPAGLSRLQFSRGGERLLVSGENGAGLVLDTATGRVLGPRLKPGALPVFCGEHDDAILRRAENGGFVVDSLQGGAIRTTPPLEGWPSQGPSRRVWPSPDGRFALLIEDALELPGLGPTSLPGAACLAEIRTGRVLWRVPGPDEQVAAWSHDSTRIAVRRGDSIISLEASTGELAGQVPRRIQNRGTQLAFLDSRDLLVFSTWSMNGLCDLAREEMRGAAPVQENWSYSRARGLLIGGTGVAEWRPSPVLRVFQPPVIEQFGVYFSYTPDEKALIVGYGPRFFWWNIDAPGSLPAATISARGASHVLFTPDGKMVRFLDDAGIHEMPWTGIPPPSLPAPLPYGPGANQHSDYVSASLNGKTIAYGGYRFALVHREGAEPLSIPTGDSANPVGLSPDGRFLALGSHHVHGFRVFDLAMGGPPVHLEDCGAGNCGVFSPDGKWLAFSDFIENTVLSTDNWLPVFHSPRRSASLLGHLSFSRDGRLLSVMDSMASCSLLEAGTWRTLARFESPLDEVFERTALSASGRYFTAVGTRREIYVWDLAALDRELRTLGFGGILPRISRTTP